MKLGNKSVKERQTNGKQMVNELADAALSDQANHLQTNTVHSQKYKNTETANYPRFRHFKSKTTHAGAIS